MSYLEMKYNLLMSYCTFLAFYLLMKVEGKPIENHPVVFKLAHIKTLFEKLKPLDSKLQYQIDKMMRLSAAHTNATVSKTALKHKPNIADLEKGAGGDDSGEEFDEDDDMAGMGSESDLEDDMGGKAKAQPDSDSEDESMDEKKQEIYKAPKHMAVIYEDKADKKKRQQD